MEVVVGARLLAIVVRAMACRPTRESSGTLVAARATRGIEVLAVNGEARGVVMVPETFDALAELASRAQITESIRAGLAEVSAGLGDDARDAMRRIASEKGIPFDR